MKKELQSWNLKLEKRKQIEKIIHAYDQAIIELSWIQSQFENAMIRARNELTELRKIAVTEELKEDV